MPPRLPRVSETMLWTLHNRASEALRPDTILHDPWAVELYRAIDFDYRGCFGRPEASHALRSLVFDEQLRLLLADQPRALILNLGEGLETQRHRVPHPGALWVSVDLPEAIALREQHLPADEGHRHLAASATDRGWINQLQQLPGARDRPAIITAQGLLMYLEPAVVARTVAMLADQLPGGVLLFDTVPGWFSRRTLRPGGWRWTRDYTVPPMPWGVDRHRLMATVRGWSPRIASVEEVPYLSRWPRGVGRWLGPLAAATPVVNRYGPAVVRVTFAGG